MPRTPFDHVKEIYGNQAVDYFDGLDDADRKTFQPFIINRAVSMNMDFVPLVDEAQKYGLLGPRETYLFFSQLIPKGKYFSKYVKSAVKPYNHDIWLIDLIAGHFSVSRAEANAYADIYYASAEGKRDLRGLCEMYAMDPKQLTKAKL